jgi:hypothetical protein
MRLTHWDHFVSISLNYSQLVPYERLQATCVLLSPQSPLIRFQLDEDSRRRIGRFFFPTLLRSLVFACPDPGHGWSMVIGGDLAIQANSHSFAFDRQGLVLA